MCSKYFKSLFSRMFSSSVSSIFLQFIFTNHIPWSALIPGYIATVAIHINRSTNLILLILIFLNTCVHVSFTGISWTCFHLPSCALYLKTPSQIIVLSPVSMPLMFKCLKGHLYGKTALVPDHSLCHRLLTVQL